ncbi:MAG TPA: hypothetical protein VM689_22050 [Aliidongia sp.]|nr:hypothetical protein [Aliidongia sp.]
MHTQPGIESHHRDQTGAISKKHGSTLVSTLRAEYGPHFAAGFASTDTLADVLASSPDHASLSQMRHDYDAGKLKRKLERRG